MERSSISSRALIPIGSTSHFMAAWWLKQVTERLLRLESPGAQYATWPVQRLYTFGEPLSSVVQSIKEADLPELGEVLDHAQQDGPCFFPHPRGKPLPPEQVEGVDETHTLANPDGVVP